MIIDRVIVGPLAENCYIVTKNNKTIIIDPGDEADKIIEATKDKNVVGILITHHHFDHVGALKELEEYFKINESKTISDLGLEVIKTPGHSSDSVCYYFKDDKVMFVGDFIFLNSIGRTDLPTGSDREMLESLEFIKNYPDDIILYPGHGESTTLGYEKNNFKYYY